MAKQPTMPPGFEIWWNGLSHGSRLELIHMGQQRLAESIPTGPGGAPDLDEPGFDPNDAPPGGWITDAERMNIHGAMTRSLAGENLLAGAWAAMKAIVLLGGVAA